MNESEFARVVRDFLVKDRGYPEESIVSELTTSSSDGRTLRPDIAIFDTSKGDLISVIEIKSSRKHDVVRPAVLQLQKVAGELGASGVPLYLFYFPQEGSGARFRICKVSASGEPEDVYADEFPHYISLLSLAAAGRKAKKQAEVKQLVSAFHWVCVGLSMVSSATLFFELEGLIELSTKHLAMAGVSMVLLALPFTAKLKILGFEFEQMNSNNSLQGRRP